MKIKSALVAIGLAITSLAPVAASAHGYGYRGGGHAGGFGHVYGARGGYGYGRGASAYRRPYAAYGYRGYGYGYAPRAWAAPGCFVNAYGQVQCPQPYYGGYGYNYGW